MPSRTLSRDAIKSIAMLTMLLNHISTVFLSPDSLLGAVLLDIGYFTAVTMCYFLVEGYGYTHSKRQYALRLALFAALSEVPYCLAFTEEGVLSFCGMNMIFTLFLCFLVLVVMERVHSRLWRELALLGLVLLSSFPTGRCWRPSSPCCFTTPAGIGRRSRRPLSSLRCFLA